MSNVATSTIIPTPRQTALVAALQLHAGQNSTVEAIVKTAHHLLAFLHDSIDPRYAAAPAADAGAANAGTVKGKRSAAQPPAEAPKEILNTPAAAPAAPSVTLPQLVAKVKELIVGGKRDIVEGTFAKFSAKDISGIKTTDYAAVLADLSADVPAADSLLS